MWFPSVCFSVDQPPTAAYRLAAGLLLWAWWAGDIDPLLQQWQPNAGSATLSAYVGS